MTTTVKLDAMPDEPMRVGAVLAFCLAAPLLAGCLAPGGTNAQVSAPEILEVTSLDCRRENATAMSMEASWLGSCWGHIGHHTYFLPEPMVLRNISGQVFAVEISYTSLADEPRLPVQISLDGRTWSTIAVLDYPLGNDALDRYTINLTQTQVDDEPFRFLRVHMPRSAHEGLAGYLDHSKFTLGAVPADARAWPEPPARTQSDCRDGLLDSFFDTHPCWFGGYDELDSMQGGQPGLVHASAPPMDESWYDAPSFLHTHYFGAGVSGGFEAQVSAQMWRGAHFVTCSAQDVANVPLTPDVVAQSSRDGRVWTTVATAPGSYLEPVSLSGELEEGTRFARFVAARGPLYEAGPCHHPTAFIVDSRLTIDPS